jgi:hypothetical protein
MCCYYDKRSTKDLRQKMARQKITFYKIYDVADSASLEKITKLPIYSTIRVSKVEVSKNGIIHSNRKQKAFSRREKSHYGVEISRGIHVYLNKGFAQQFVKRTCSILVKVKAMARDLIGANGDWRLDRTAVFMKIRINVVEVRKQIDKVLRDKRIRRQIGVI